MKLTTSAIIIATPSWWVGLGLSIFLAGAPLGLGQSAQPYATIVSLGDSLSDTGNNPPTGDYYQGRWSNGPLWDENLAADYGSELKNLAYAGSETSDLPRQAGLVSGLSLDFDTTLCTIWSGANDFIQGATNGLNEVSWNKLVNAGVADIGRALDALYESGARHFLVFNLPDLSKTPAGLAFPAEVRTFAQGKVILFNTKLAAVLAAFRKSKPQARVAFVDAFNLLDQILSDPAADGFANVTSDALADFGDPAFDGPAANYLFWDEIHPTTKAHELISQWATNALTAAPPVILVQPASQTVVAGSNVVFTVEVSGNASFQWRFHGRNIAGATNESYAIDSARTSNAGTYSVTVRNAYGAISSSNAVLAVVLPPKILKQPASQTALAGRTVRFRILAAGTAPLRYQWLFDAEAVSGATNALLTLLDAQTNQAGTYSVVVTNAGGSVTSSNAVLSVSAVAP
jgi:phospholipase/lecithinase/hemolysin